MMTMIMMMAVGQWHANSVRPKVHFEMPIDFNIFENHKVVSFSALSTEAESV